MAKDNTALILAAVAAAGAGWYVEQGKTVLGVTIPPFPIRFGARPPTAPQALAVTVTSPTGTVGRPYTAVIAVTGGTPPYQVAATGLPPGLAVQQVQTSAVWQITGTPVAAGSYPIAVVATDSAGNAASTAAAIVVRAARTTPAPSQAPSATGGTTTQQYRLPQAMTPAFIARQYGISVKQLAAMQTSAAKAQQILRHPNELLAAGNVLVTPRPKRKAG